MHFQFLVEDQSIAILVDILMGKIAEEDTTVTFSCKFFKGIGGFTKKNTVKETKEGKMLNDLATYMRGFNKSLQGIPAAIFVVLDNDTRDTNEFLCELNNVAESNQISVDYVFCIAVEEIEAWLLGDRNALTEAYPNARLQYLESYEQDSICGTWERLADAIYPGGLSKFKKECPSYMEIGFYKSKWANDIGNFMNIEGNSSPSFNLFIGEINKRINRKR